MEFKKNDSLCFIGDSITAAEKYVRIIVDYFVLNYPEKHIMFHNVGVPGTAMPEAINNWDRQFVMRKPTHATVMFGMNDMNRVLYADSAKVTDELLEKRRGAIERYKANLGKIHSLLGDTPHLFLTPTPHDESPEIESPLYGGYDLALKEGADYILANYKNVIDVRTPFKAANDKRLVKTIVGPDRVHPGNIGHAMIAKTILAGFGFEDLRLPLWDSTITEEEKAVMKKLGIEENPAPKNPFSDERSRLARKVIDFYYVEMNVLAGVDLRDEELVTAKLKEFLSMPIEQWRIDSYTDYLENRHTLPEREAAAIEAMKKMYTA